MHFIVYVNGCPYFISGVQIIKDEGDNFLLELALAGNADYIITNNMKDLKGVDLNFPTLNIVTPHQLLKKS